VLLGAPGSGKGTQAEMITRHFAIAVTSPGTILRRERDLGTPLGIKADEISKQGGLVPDEIIVHLIEDWLALHGKDGFVFDGFPRTKWRERVERNSPKASKQPSTSPFGWRSPNKRCAIASPAGYNVDAVALRPA
jgi:adenylate kinase family enzyme